MKNKRKKSVVDLLNQIMEMELAGVVRYTHYSFMVYGYNRIGSPWPVSDRDVVLRSRRSDLPDGGIRLEFENTTTPEVPPVDGVVRMRRLVGSYALRPEGTGTHVVYTLDSDPGGSLPGWLVRQASKDLPYYTLRNLRERAEAGPPPAP